MSACSEEEAKALRGEHQREGEVHDIKRGREEGSAGVRRATKFFFEFYALLATQFSLRRQCIRWQGARRYVPFNVTALTAVFICLFQF